MKHRRFWIMSLPRLKWNSFFAVLAVCNTEKQLALAEELFAFHTIKHSQSFRWFVRRKWSKHCTTKKLHVQGQKAKQLFVMFFHHVRFRNCRKNWIHAHLYPYILMLPTTKIFGYRIPKKKRRLSHIRQLSFQYDLQNTNIRLSFHTTTDTSYVIELNINSLIYFLFN